MGRREVNGSVRAFGSIDLKPCVSVYAEKMHVNMSIIRLHVWFFFCFNSLISLIESSLNMNNFDVWPHLSEFQVPSVVSPDVPRGRKGVAEVSLNRGPSGHR